MASQFKAYLEDAVLHITVYPHTNLFAWNIETYPNASVPRLEALDDLVEPSKRRNEK